MKLSQNIETGDTVIKICLYVITRKLRGPQWNKGLESGRDRDLSFGEMAGNWSANPPFRDIRPRRTKPRPYTHRRRPVYRLFSWGSTTANNSWLLEIPVRHTDPFSDKGIQKKKKKLGGKLPREGKLISTPSVTQFAWFIFAAKDRSGYVWGGVRRDNLEAHKGDDFACS